MIRIDRSGFRAFSDYNGFDVFDAQKQKIVADINSQPDDYILNVNKAEYVAHLVEKYRMNPVEIHSDQLSVSVEERKTPAEEHPRSYRVLYEKSYLKDVYTLEKIVSMISGLTFIVACWFIFKKIFNSGPLSTAMEKVPRDEVLQDRKKVFSHVSNLPADQQCGVPRNTQRSPKYIQSCK